MTKRKATFILVLILVVVSITIWIVKDFNKLNNLNTTEIKAITIHNPVEYFTVTEASDIQLLLTTLQSMKLRRTLSRDKDGFAFLIDIELTSGHKEHISILSGNIRINGHSYWPDQDYTNRIREVFEKLSQKYEIYSA